MTQPNQNWREFFKEHGDSSIKGFGYPEEGSRNLGTVEELYQHIKSRLWHDVGHWWTGDGVED